MDEARRAFERFESRGAGWLPIIVMSAVGVLGTIVSLNIVVASARRNAATVDAAIFQLGLMHASVVPLHNVIEPVDASEVPTWLSDASQEIANEIPDMDYVLCFRDGLDKSGGGESSNEDGRFVSVWLSENRLTAVYLAWITPESDDLEDGFVARDWVAQSLAISLTKDGGKPLVTRWSLGFLELPDWIQETESGSEVQWEPLLEMHREFTSSRALRELQNDRLLVAYRRYFADQVKWLIARGGYSTEALAKSLSDTDLANLADEFALTYDLGLRDGWTRELDAMILTHLIASGKIQEDNASDDHLVVHSLSSPLRTFNRLERGIDNVDDNDLVDRRLGETLPEVQQNVSKLIQQNIDDGRLTVVADIKEPFQATVYRITRP